MEPEWTDKEFDTLLKNPALTSGQLQEILPARSVGAIIIMREFIHNYHIGRDISGLSKLMVMLLKNSSWECPKCHGVHFLKE